MNRTTLTILTLIAALSSPGETHRRLSFDGTSLILDGQRQFLISGEFHYFRVPKADWRKRLELLKASGGNCVATYIPWCLHEEKEGDIRFGDVPERDLDGFLNLVREMGLVAIVRPGPYQYSELIYDGLPRWLIEGHPEILKKYPDGRVVRSCSVDYNHPYFLKKVRTYFHAVAALIRPHLDTYGGPIALVQLDNELTGIHTWFGYPRSTAYFEDCADYLATLRGYLEENGITGPYCHNAGGALFVAPDFPRVDLDGKPCTILADALEAGVIEPSKQNVAAQPVVEILGERLYGYAPKFVRGGENAAVWRAGKGKVRWLGCTWQQRYVAQATIMKRFMAELGAKPIVASSNPNVLTTAYHVDGASGVRALPGDGHVADRLGMFVLNLRASPQETTLSRRDGKPIRVTLPPMTVEYKEL